VSHLVGQALAGDRRDRVAAADHDGRAVLRAVRQQTRHCVRAMRKGRDLEDAERPVPEHGLDVREHLDHQVLAGLAEVDDVPAGGDLLRLQGLVLGAACDLLGHDHVDREHDPDLVLLGPRQDATCVVDAVGLGKALADRLALREQEGVRHPSAEHEQVDLRQQVVNDLDLVADLGPAKDRGERSLGVLEQLREHRELALHQQPGICRQELGDADGTGMRPMGGPERVVHIQVGVRREGRGESRVVRLLLRVEPQVLEQDDLAGAHPLECVFGADAEGIACDRHVAAQQLGQPLADRAQAKAVGDLAVGSAQVAGEDDLRPGLHERDDGRDRGADPRVILHLAVGERDIEVDAHEDALAGDIRIADRELVHGG
jgi:hypothetical protein